MDGELVIDVHGLTKSFGDTKVVDDFSIQVPKGAIYGFLGPNGSGKTTTIRLMCGLLRPDGGGGTALGYDIVTQSREIKSRVGYMTQKFSLYGDLTVKENLDFMARLHAVPNQKQTVRATLEEYDLDPRAQTAWPAIVGWVEAAPRAGRLHDPRPRVVVAG